MQDSTQTVTLNQLAGYTRTCLSFDTSVRTQVVRRSFLDTKHGSCCEIQLQSAESFMDDPTCRHTISPEPKQPQTAAPDVSRNNMSDSDNDGSERGIEFPEEGHVEMLEHALGKQLRTYCQSINISYSPGWGAFVNIRLLTCFPAFLLGCCPNPELGVFGCTMSWLLYTDMLFGR